MKRFLVFLFAVAFTGQAWAAAITFTVGNLRYTVTDGTNVYVKAASNITEANIPSEVTYPETDGTTYTVTSIGEEAFHECRGLTSVTIPNSVTSIGSSAFYDCSSLTSVTIPYSVTSIGSAAFSCCSSLTSVTIPESVTSIGDYAFNACQSLTSFVIPNTVTRIGNYTFCGCNGLTSVTIPESVTSIGIYAFYLCSSLTTVTIPNSVISIGYNAFHYCRSLTSVTIPYSVTSIGSAAFSCCSSLTSVTIPESVTIIGEDTFLGCVNLTDINVESDNTKYSSQDGVLFNKDKTTIVCYPAGKTETTYTTPESVTSIGSSAFYDCSSLTSVTIGNSVKSIGNYAFGMCSGFTTLTIGSGVENIGTNAFTNCPIETLAYNSNYVGSIFRSTFPYADIKTINIGDAVTSIDDGTFQNCTHLTSLSIGSGVETIGTDAFKNCPIETLTYNSNIAGAKLDGLTTLKTVNIGDAVTTISNGAFRNSTGLTDINVSADNDNFCSIDGVVFSKDKKTLIRYPAGKSGSYTIPDGVTAIGMYAFYNCKNLTSVTIPNSVTSIGSFAFYQCYGFESIIIPESVESIADNAFGSCLKLKSITIPGSVKSVGNSAFSMCVLESVIFENGVTSIGSSVFSNCKKLKSVTIPNSVTSIGQSAFYECSNLESVTLPNNITSIKYGMFSGCSSLPSINIPEGVTSIADYAFNGCSSFTSITIPGSVTSMGHGAFYGCSGLTSICIPESVTSFGKYVFKNCTDLAGVCYEGSNVPEFGESMFDGDDGLNYVCVPATYTGDSWGGKPIMKSGHQVIIEPATATCTEPGLSEGSYCSYCGKVFAMQQAVSAFGHSYSTAVTNPTCIEIGYTTHTCSVCSHTYNSDTVSAKGHKPDSVEFENIVSATCTAAGSKDSVVFCSVCQVEISREERVIPALGHTEVVNEAVAPTCTKAGKTEGKYCSVCSAVIKLPIAIPATGHTADSVEFENVVPATCTAAGSKDSVVFCSVCQDELLREKKVIPAKGHTIVIDEAVEPTCTKTGLGEGKHCSVCNEYEWTQELIPPLGHDFGKYVYNNDATLEADGTETATCSRCGEKDTRVAEGTKLNATAVSDAAASTLNIYAHHNTIVVENATDEIFVYNAMGTLICRDATPCVRMEINVNAPGIYIVKVGGTVKRVMVN